MSAFDRVFVSVVVWLSVLEEGADVQYSAWLYRLNDPRDAWWAPDKWSHFFGPAWIAAEVNTAFAMFLIIVWEIGEAALWMSLTSTKRLLIEDGKVPWPFLHDRVSLKDIAFGLMGIGAHRLFSWVGF